MNRDKLKTLTMNLREDDTLNKLDKIEMIQLWIEKLEDTIMSQIIDSEKLFEASNCIAYLKKEIQTLKDKQ